MWNSEFNLKTKCLWLVNVSDPDLNCTDLGYVSGSEFRFGIRNRIPGRAKMLSNIFKVFRAHGCRGVSNAKWERQSILVVKSNRRNSIWLKTEGYRTCRYVTQTGEQFLIMFSCSFSQCCGSMTFWCRSGSGSTDLCLWLMDPDPDPALFVIDLKMPTKNKLKIFFSRLLGTYFLNVHLHHFQR